LVASLLAPLLALLLLVPELVAEGIPVAVLEDDADDEDEADGDDDVELDELDDELDDTSGESDGPNVCLPVLRSCPMTLKLALFTPRVWVPVRTLNQQGVADVKLRSIATVELNPGAFCW
jgi:hypothetical protein